MKRRWQIVILVALIIGLCAASYAALHWRSFTQQPATGSTSSQQSSGPVVPDREESLALISGTMKSFAQGLTKKDFTDFYGTFSDLWKKQTTPAAVADAMHQFFPFGREVQKSVTESDPYLNAPVTIVENRILVLQGFYRIAGTKLLFKLQYVQENSSWKLLGMELSVK